MTEMQKDPPIKNLECCCCGAGTQGRQWWNRDTGYGLCSGCVVFCGADVELGAHDPEKAYGIHGYHYDLPEDGLTRVAVAQAVYYGMTYADHGRMAENMATIAESVTEAQEMF